jgi:glucan phosphorylase
MNTSSPLILEIAMEMALPTSFLDKIANDFGASNARNAAMSTSVGGIGPLLRERVAEQGDQNINVIGVSLLYESVWVQAWHEWGQINLQKQGIGPMLRSRLQKTDLGFEIRFFDGEEAHVDVWALPYGKAMVYFLSVPSITEVVYPGPSDMPKNASTNSALWAHVMRLKHSWLVGRGALLLMKKLGLAPDITVLSETPTIFGHHRLVQDSLQNDDFFKNTKYIFNDHTPLEYAHPIWDQATLELVKMDPHVYEPTPAWVAPKRTLDVTSLLVGICEAVYGVAKKHGEVMKAMPSLHEFRDRIEYVTNGVRREDWQAPEFVDPSRHSDEELLELKRQRRILLLDWVWRHCGMWPTWMNESQHCRVVAWTRRITPYKRLDLLAKMLREPRERQKFLDLEVIVLVGGRIHQQDNQAQAIVYDLIELLQRDTELAKRIITVNNFNVWDARLLYQGVDGSIMLADDTREASATGFMKAQMNGAAVLATSDGAVPEFVYFKDQAPEERMNGFFIPYVNGEPTAEGLLKAFGEFSEVMHRPASAAKLIRAALAVTKDVSVTRTVLDVKKIYDRILS